MGGEVLDFAKDDLVGAFERGGRGSTQFYVSIYLGGDDDHIGGRLASRAPMYRRHA